MHNEVKDIERFAREFQVLVPEGKVRFAHGQMRERELEQVMIDFYHARFNILVCTTIIESGIDVPTANTILIDRADHLGLAQLHQLRGRVGRQPSTAPMPTCWCPAAARCLRTLSAAWRPSSSSASWAPASRSPPMTWKSAAPASTPG